MGGSVWRRMTHSGRPAVVLVARVLACALMALACRGGPDAVEPAWLPGIDIAPDVSTRGFSGSTALEDARRLARLEHGADDDARRLRAWLADELHRMGADTGRRARAADTSGAVDRQAADEVSGEAGDEAASGVLVGVLPGRSTDVILLGASYGPGPRHTAADDPAAITAASGGAVLLELGRALAARPRPYTVWLAFVPRVEEAPAGDGSSPSGPPPTVEPFRLDRVRLAVFFESLALPDLRVVRDLRSHRVHRESFWSSARALGLEAVFVPDSPFGSPAAAHRLLLAHDFRAVVALVGEGGAPEAGRGGEAFAAATATRLDEFGAVVLDALEGIANRLSRIDSFASAPPP